MNEFWKEKLNVATQACYEQILTGLRKRAETIPCGDVSQQTVLDTYTAVYRDHPELFYIGSQSCAKQSCAGFGGFFSRRRVETSLSVINVYDDRTIDRCHREIQAICNRFRRGENDFHTILQCVEYIVLHTEYEIDCVRNQNAAAALCFHKAQCSGIAKALKLLLDHLGIFCIVVDGTAFDEHHASQSHAWNIVRVNGRYYHVDPTFMLGANTDKRRPLRRRCMFVDDARLSHSHQWDRRAVPPCDDPQPYTLFNTVGEPRPHPSREALPTYRSLHELKAALRRLPDARGNTLRFVLDIPATDIDQRLHLIDVSCQMVLPSVFDASVNYTIEATGNEEIVLTVTK